MSKLSIDLNCDMGESFGQYQLGNDAAIMPLISSANIACGFHAGDPTVMARTVRCALSHGVAMGAHPGLPDLQGFGRRNLAISPTECFEMVLYQIGALQALVHAEGGRLNHVKPHGALYNMAAADARLAHAIADAVHRFNPELILFGLAGSELIKAGNYLGLTTANEVFSDRRYLKNGSLTPRTQANAMIESDAEALAQVYQMVLQGTVETNDGTAISVQADTLCIHGDGSHALSFAENIAEFFKQKEIAIKAIR